MGNYLSRIITFFEKIGKRVDKTVAAGEFITVSRSPLTTPPPRICRLPDIRQRRSRTRGAKTRLMRHCKGVFPIPRRHRRGGYHPPVISPRHLLCKCHPPLGKGGFARSIQWRECKGRRPHRPRASLTARLAVSAYPRLTTPSRGKPTLRAKMRLAPYGASLCVQRIGNAFGVNTRDSS